MEKWGSRPTRSHSGGMSLIQSLRRVVTWHRRILAATLSGLAALCLLNVARPAPEATVPVAMTRSALSAGAELTAADIEIVDVPERLAPDGGMSTVDELVGRTLNVRLPARAAIVDSLVTQAPDEGRAVVPIRLGDEALAAYLQPGMAVQLVSVDADGIATVIANARITAMSSAAEGNFAMGSEEPLVLVDVPVESAAQVSVLGQQGDLAVVLGSG